tara:strand:- start:1273 stop:1527 length:255 start_codon:yes stop_codon:yes gene_type:complete
MAKKKQLYFNKVTQQGQEDNICPECDGDAVFVGDYEDGGNDIDITPCSLCDATGIAILNIDYKINIDYMEEGPVHEIVPIFKSK